MRQSQTGNNSSQRISLHRVLGAEGKAGGGRGSLGSEEQWLANTASSREAQQRNSEYQLSRSANVPEFHLPEAGASVLGRLMIVQSE
ncbi:hypothetical protein Y032_0119g818 [Ancylostoma ceylanicum]|uniref:Uncharacterized protein n=1 Tax=Ancylostoma ceylanicum TaxID=53326 RepID=A0A016TB44_9BILA|nr:hypothetical protein Y032_0119g818 [Ancylostoma ceylanicum]